MNALDKFIGKHKELAHLKHAERKTQDFGPNKGKKIENRLKAPKKATDEQLICDSYFEDCR